MSAVAGDRLPLRILQQPDTEDFHYIKQSILGKTRYSYNQAYFHRYSRLLQKKAHRELSRNQIPEDRLTPNTDLQTVGTKHIAFATDDMDALKAGFVENGVDIAHEVRMDGEAVMFVRDCNGVLLEFIQGK